MDRNRTQIRKTMPRYMLQLATAATLALTACSERAPEPGDPSNPPRPETASGYVIKANFVLPARPVPPSHGWM